MKDDVVYKLDSFLRKESVFNEESDVLYFMVEVRKVLDHLRKAESQPRYSILRFYADWAVHIQKDSITSSMKQVIGQVNTNIPHDIQTNQFAVLRKGYIQNHNDFIYMRRLQEELYEFLKEHSLPLDLIKEDVWTVFLSNLVSILVDQPIVNPIPDIKQILFLPSAPGAVICVIEFNDERGIFKSGNMY